MHDTLVRLRFGFSAHIQGVWLQTSVALVFLALFQVILLYPLHRSMDIPAWDESMYVGRGLSVAQGLADLPTMVGSPMYVFAYAVLTRLIGTINSVFAMTYFLGICIPLLLFLFLYQRISHISLSVFLAMVYSVSEHNLSHTISVVNSVPVLNTILVYRFGVLVFLMSLLLIQKNSVVSVVFLLMCAYVRQEYLFIFVPYTLYLLFHVYFERKRISFDIRKAGWFNISISAVIILFFLYFFQAVPGSSWGSSTGRTWFAFAQHYSVDQVRAGLYTLDPWIDYNVVISKEFPLADSLTSALYINPEAFMYHIGKNIMRIPNALHAFLCLQLCYLKRLFSRCCC